MAGSNPYQGQNLTPALLPDSPVYLDEGNATGEQPVMMSPATAPPNPPAPAVAASRSAKAAMGVGTILNQNPADISQAISSGQEDDYRNDAAAKLNLQAAQDKQQAIVDLAKKTGGPITQSDYDKIQSGTTVATPDDVIERGYSTAYVAGINNAADNMQTTVLDQANQEIPKVVDDVWNKSTELQTKLEFAHTLGENLDNEISAQSWPGYLVDQAKTMFQPYNEYKMRGNNPDVGKISGGFLLGDNLKEQADNLFMKPMAEYKKGLTDIVTNLRKDNPTLARQFVDYVEGTSENERKLQNVYTILAPQDYISVAKSGTSLLRKIELNNRVNKAFKDVVESSRKPNPDTVPTKAVVAEAAGDNGEAAVIRAGNSVVQDLNGNLNPVLDTKEKLTSNFRLDAEALDSNPGNLSKAEMTVLKDGFYKAGSNLFDTIMNAVRVNRTPVPLASEDAMRAYKEVVKSQFPGLDEAILDVGSPIYDQATNTYHVPVTFGNHGRDLFSSPETTRAFAERYGFADIRLIGEGEGNFKHYIPESSVKNFAGTANENFGYSIKNGSPKFYSDIVNGVEVKSTSKPGVGMVPVEIKDGKAIFGKTLTTETAHIEQQGLGFKFTVVKPYNESEDIVKSWLINDKKAKSTGSAEGFESWKNASLGWLRGADDTLSYNETLQRKVATYTQTLLKQWQHDEIKKIEAVANRFKFTKPSTWDGLIRNNSQKFQEFNSTLKFARTVDDPVTGLKGYFFKTPGELQDHYQRFFRRMPGMDEIEAYFAHVKLTEGDRVLSELAEYRNRAARGTEQHRISVADGKTLLQSDFFDGVHERVFPGGKDQIMIMGARKGDERLYNLGANNIPPKDLQRFREQVKAGEARIIRIWDPDSHPLQGFSDVAGQNRIRYVMSYNSESKPLDFNHVNRRGGGHFNVDADHYVKQANMVQEMAGSLANDKRSLVHATYTGDRTFMPVSNRAMGKDIAEKMNLMNKHMREKNNAAAEALSRSLGIEYKDMKSWYNPSRDQNGNILRPRLDMNEDFHVVPKNRKIIDLGKSIQDKYGSNFRDGTKSGSDAQQFQVAYNQVRDVEDLHTLKDEGSQGNPIYKYVPADYVDPIPTMNRALQRAINSTFMDDYKMYAVNHWLEEAIPHLKDEADEVRSAPFWYFNNIDKSAFVSASGNEVVSNLLSNRMKIKGFLGTPNKIDTAVHSLTQLLADKFYEKLGPEDSRSVLGKAVSITPIWALGKIKDPVSAIRSFAFNAKLGVFALPQMLVQAQTYTSIIALEPIHGLSGTFATLLHQWSRINKNPEVLKALDEYASKFTGFKPGEWMEARRELAKTGFEHVGGEYAMADDQLNAKPIKNTWGNFLDAGQIFFREGEKASRLGAYYTAFREFRAENGLRAITDADRAAILNKADLLTTNMSRASSSILHGGILSLPTQFLSYQLRMAELFLGKRIGETTTERTLARARLVTMYAAMYGAPSALGITGYPFGDSFREAAINNGYVVGDKFLSSLMMEGIPAMALSMISGGGDFTKGNHYNVGDRYGSQGFTALSESFRSDKTMWSILGGAGNSVLMNTIANLDPFWQSAKSLLSPDEEGNKYPLTTSDFADLFNEVSSVDSARRLYMAMNTGKWMTKNLGTIADVSAASATFMAMTGLKPQEQDDIFALHNIKNTEEEGFKAAEKLITKDYQRGVMAYFDNDPATGDAMMKRVRARMISANIPQDMQQQILHSASLGYEKQIDSSVQNWATKNVPAGQELTRLDAYSRTKILRNQQ